MCEDLLYVTKAIPDVQKRVWRYSTSEHTRLHYYHASRRLRLKMPLQPVFRIIPPLDLAQPLIVLSKDLP